MVKKRELSIRDVARMGAAAVNKMMTPEKRSAAARKGWRNRRKKSVGV